MTDRALPYLQADLVDQTTSSHGPAAASDAHLAFFRRHDRIIGIGTVLVERLRPASQRRPLEDWIVRVQGCYEAANPLMRIGGSMNEDQVEGKLKQGEGKLQELVGDLKEKA